MMSPFTFNDEVRYTPLVKSLGETKPKTAAPFLFVAANAASRR